MKYVSAEHSLCALQNKWQSSHWAPWVRVPLRYPNKIKRRQSSSLSFTVSRWNENFEIGLTLSKLSPRESSYLQASWKSNAEQGSWQGQQALHHAPCCRQEGEVHVLAATSAGVGLCCSDKRSWQCTRCVGSRSGRPLLAFSDIRESLTWVRAIKSRQKQLFESHSQNSQQAFDSVIDYGT